MALYGFYTKNVSGCTFFIRFFGVVGIEIQIGSACARKRKSIFIIQYGRNNMNIADGDYSDQIALTYK